MILQTRFTIALNLGLTTIFHSSTLQAQNVPSRELQEVKYIQKVAIPIELTCAGEKKFADLEPLVNEIADARIVCLGEQSHGDGATFQAKVKLVKFLHQRMGFDVIAWESGYYDCQNVQHALTEGIDPKVAIWKGISPPWASSLQVVPVFEYIANSSKTKHPLVLAGFDAQISSLESFKSLSVELKSLFKKICPEALTPEFSSSIKLIASDGNFQSMAPEDRASRLKFYDELYNLFSVNLPRSSTIIGQTELGHWGKVIENLKTYFLFQEALKNQRGIAPGESTSIREMAMAKNLRWLAEDIFPKKKIIVWAATRHIVSKLKEFAYSEDEGVKVFPGESSMVDYFKKESTAKIYTIGFSSYQGSIAYPWVNGREMEIPKAPGNSFTHYFHLSGIPSFYFPFKHLESIKGLWQLQPLVDTQLGYMPLIAVWPNSLDAVIYIDKMTPSLRVQSIKRP